MSDIIMFIEVYISHSMRALEVKHTGNAFADRKRFGGECFISLDDKIP